MKHLIILLFAIGAMAQEKPIIKKGFKTPEELTELYLNKKTRKQIKQIFFEIDRWGNVVSDSIKILDKNYQEITTEETFFYKRELLKFQFETAEKITQIYSITKIN